MVDLKNKTKQIKKVVKAKVQQTDEFVKEHPYKTMGLVAGVCGVLGVVAGWFLGRRKK